MRPTRYRVWDKLNGHWMDLSTQAITLTADSSKTQVSYTVSHINGIPIYEGNIINMQYTGLYDDTGQEIAQYDICFAFKKGSGLNGYYKVVWDGTRGRWAYQGSTMRERYQVGKAGNMHCKILGNEFDNPTLDYMRKHN